jgi:pimeloyl-ACP methyl ester carboxylesterase
MRVEESFAVAADGTRIWWRSAGRGSPAVILSDGISCAGYIWRHLFPALAARGRVLHFNHRGHGRSAVPRDPERVSMADCAGDLFAVLDAAGEPSAVLAGHSMGVQVCLEAHRRRPERVRGLALLCGVPGRVLDHFHGRRVLAATFPFIRSTALRAPRLARWCFHRLLAAELTVQLGLAFEVNRQLLPREDLEAYLAEAAQVDVEVYCHMLSSAAQHDATDHLPRVDVPTLVVAGDRDTWTPFPLSTAMCAAIPAAELLVLRAGTHTGPLEHPELVALRLEKFLDERVRHPAPGLREAVAPDERGGIAARSPATPVRL